LQARQGCIQWYAPKKGFELWVLGFGFQKPKRQNPELKEVGLRLLIDSYIGEEAR
jgi:hypothetical protein